MVVGCDNVSGAYMIENQRQSVSNKVIKLYRLNLSISASSWHISNNKVQGRAVDF